VDARRVSQLDTIARLSRSALPTLAKRELRGSAKDGPGLSTKLRAGMQWRL
jgi:hypothetical protein